MLRRPQAVADISLKNELMKSQLDCQSQMMFMESDRIDLQYGVVWDFSGGDTCGTDRPVSVPIYAQPANSLSSSLL